MKPPIYESSPGALYTFIAERPQAVAIADLYTFNLNGSINSGVPLTYTTSDRDVTVPYSPTPITYSSSQLYIDQKQNKSYSHQKVGLDVDQWQVIVTASANATVNGVPLFEAIAQQILYQATATVDRAFFDTRVSPLNPPLVGIVRLFSGPVSDVQIGRSNAIIIINDWRIVLQQSMPRNLFGQLCRWQLFGAGCELVASSFVETGTVSADYASNINVIDVSVGAPGGSGTYILGDITFTSGLNLGISRMITNWTGSGTPPTPSYSVWDQTASAIAAIDQVGSGSITFSTNGLTAQFNGDVANEFPFVFRVQVVEGKTSGKWFFEFSGNNWLTNTIFDECGFGLASVFPQTGKSASPAGGCFYGCSGSVYINGGTTTGYPAAGGSRTVGIAVDIGNSLAWFNVNGIWYGAGGTTGDPSTGTNGINISSITALGPIFPAFWFGNTASPITTTANLGQSGFVNTTPAGFTPGWTVTKLVFGSFAADGGFPEGSTFTRAAPPSGSKAVCQFTLTQAAAVDEIDFIFSNSGTQAIKAVIYDNTGPTFSSNGNGPGALIAVSGAISSFTEGYNVFTISPTVNLEPGTYFLGLVTTGSVTANALVTEEEPVEYSILYNSDGYTSPSSPFGTPTVESFGPYPIRAAVSLNSIPASFQFLSGFPFPISSGDAFDAYPGCSHTLGACASFDNTENFGGQDRIPNPEKAL